MDEAAGRGTGAGRMTIGPRSPRWLYGLAGTLFLTGCSSLDQLAYEPQYTPQEWLVWQPNAEAWFAGRSWILMQPSSTVFVYLLGIIAAVMGLRFLRRPSGGEPGKGWYQWWGAALLLWGAGALLAGTSYELFSYEIKCAGWDLCRWTSWWEIAYLLLSLASVNAMAAAQAVRLGEPGCMRLNVYAAFNTVLYFLLVGIGALVPVRFLISFEMLILFAVPTIIIFLWINGIRSRQESVLDRRLLWIWIGLIAVIGAYFGYYLLGFTEELWQQGIWFSENDILHIGLIIWMFAVYRVVGSGEDSRRSV